MKALSYNSKLATAALNKAKDMFAKNYWSHYGPNGETPWQFINATGYTYIYAGENLARGYQSASEAVTAWMNSSSHRANILKGEYTETGVAVLDGNLQGEDTTLIVQMFGTPPGGSSSSSSSSVSSSTSTSVSTTTSATVASSKASSKTSSTSTKATSTKSSSKSSTSSVNVVPEIPKINEPKTELTVNSLKISIKGTGGKNNTILIYESDKLLGQTNADQNGNWVLSEINLHEGENLLTSIGSINNQQSSKSEIVKVIVDTLKLSYSLSDIFDIKATDDRKNIFTFSIKVTLNKNVTQTEGDKLDLINSNSFTLNYESQNIKDKKFSFKDLAGNSIEVNLSKQMIDDLFSKYINAHAELTKISNNSIPQYISDLPLRNKVNLAFAIVLSILLFIDWLILYFKKINIFRSKSLLHLVPIAMIIALSLVNGIGKIL